MIAFHRSGAVRIAVLFLGLFACTVVAAFAVTYLMVREEIVAHLRANIVAGADAIAARLAHEPPDLVFSSSSRQRVAALFNADGKLVIGEPGLIALHRLARDPGRQCRAAGGSRIPFRDGAGLRPPGGKPELSWSAREWTSWRIRGRR